MTKCKIAVFYKYLFCLIFFVYLTPTLSLSATPVYQSDDGIFKELDKKGNFYILNNPKNKGPFKDYLVVKEYENDNPFYYMTYSEVFLTKEGKDLVHKGGEFDLQRITGHLENKEDFFVIQSGWNERLFLKKNERSFYEKAIKNAKKGQYDKKPHVIFFVHGLMGDESTFGEGEQMLRKLIGPYKNIRTKSLSYPTNPESGTNTVENQKQHPFDFAKIINSKIISYLVEQNLADRKRCPQLIADGLYESEGDCFKHAVDLETPYTLIVHSQGGLTAMSYMNSCLMRENQRVRCLYSKGLYELVKISSIKKQFDDILGLGKKRPKDQCTESPAENCIKKIKHVTIKDLVENKDKLEALLKCKGKNSCDPNLKKLLENLLENLHSERISKWETPVAQNLAGLITLGSPFWGSHTANWGQELESLFNVNGPDSDEGLVFSLLKNMFDNLPSEQLIRLSIGSSGTTWQRTLMSDRTYMKTPQGKRIGEDFNLWNKEAQWQSRFPSNLQVFNLAGALKHLKEGYPTPYNKTNWAISKIRKPYYNEHDIIVGAPEARVDFLYNMEAHNKKAAQNGASLKGRTNLALSNYYPIDISHVPIMESGNLGMAFFTFYHENIHPGYQMTKVALSKILCSIHNDFMPLCNGNNLVTANNVIADKIVSPLYNFTSEIKMITPIGYHRPFKIYHQNVEMKNESNDIEHFRLSDHLGLKMSGWNKYAVKMRDHFYQTYFHVGRVKEGKEFHFEQAQQSEKYLDSQLISIDYRLKVLGFKTKSFQSNVQASWTSLSEMFLEPILIDTAKELKPQSTKKKWLLSQTQLQPLNAKDTSPVSFILEYENDTYKVQTKKEFHSPNDKVQYSCRLARVGEPTMNQFKHRKNDYDKFKDENPWKKAAIHQNHLYAKFDSTSPDKALQSTPGATIEILGRFKVGKTGEYGQGRPCTLSEEKADAKNHQGECNPQFKKPQFDRYLVTSKSIRRHDNVKNIKDLKEGHGLRWMNVVDVDLYDLELDERAKKLKYKDLRTLDLWAPGISYIPNAFTAYKKFATDNYTLKALRGDECLFDTPNNDYIQTHPVTN